MATERGEWSLSRRVAFLPLAWIAHMVFYVPAQFTFGLVTYMAGRRHLVERSTVFWASIPVLLYAMRHSRFFVKWSEEAVSTVDRLSAVPCVEARQEQAELSLPPAAQKDARG